MSIYKVRVKRIGSTTFYITNSYELARIETVSGHFQIMHDNKIVATAITIEEAEQEARKAITRLMAFLGVIPNFIDEPVCNPEEHQM